MLTFVVFEYCAQRLVSITDRTRLAIVVQLMQTTSAATKGEHSMSTSHSWTFGALLEPD